MTQMFQNLHRSLKPFQTLKLQCDACPRQAILSHADAVARFGADATPTDIRARAVCRACGGKARVWI